MSSVVRSVPLTPPPAPSSPSYRPDIDGLRAVAVGAVLLFHVAPSVLPGGFFGVDVFFVISGFLISTLILQNLRDGRFTFADFYMRRARRLLPALLVVLAATLIAGWWVLLPAEYQALGKDTAGSAAFVANFVLWSEAGYFFQPDRTPLLHLWSLGVEEQFYLLWPAVLWLAFRRRWPIGVVVAGLALASFAFNIHLTYTDRSTAFFSPLTRGWEFLLGAALAVGLSARSCDADAAPARLRDELRAGVGLVMLLAPMLHVTGERAIPGWWSLGPTLGTALVISAGPHAAVNRYALGSRPFVTVGLVSYPLYLWHWPALSLTTIVQNPPSIAARLVAALASVGLAWITWRVVETPVRFRTRHWRVPAALCAGLVVLAVAGVLVYDARLPPRSASFGLGPFLAAAAEPTGTPGPEGERVVHDGHAFARLGPGGAVTTLFVGDSKMNHYWARVAELVRTTPDRGAVFATCPGAPPIPGVRAYRQNPCSGLPEAAASFARTSVVDTVVVGAAWNNDFSGAFYVEADGARLPVLVNNRGGAFAFTALERMLAEFVRAGKTAWLVLDSPSGPALHPANLVRRSLGGFTLEARSVSRREVAIEHGALRERLVATAARAGAQVIDPMDALCAGDVCPALADGLPIYLDTGHLRPSFARERIRFLDVTLRPGAAARR